MADREEARRAAVQAEWQRSVAARREAARAERRMSQEPLPGAAQAAQRTSAGARQEHCRPARSRPATVQAARTGNATIAAPPRARACTQVKSAPESRCAKRMG